jgi:hypothetical protein
MRAYRIIESCMRPSGAYVHTQSTWTTEAAARKAFQRACFEGPGYGILRSKTLTLTYSGHEGGQYDRTVLAQRDCD